MTKKIIVYNTLAKKKEILEPINPGAINIYSCGPTVYDHSHIGHARSAISWDFIVRFLRFVEYRVIWTRNITDIDDKIINKAKEINLHPDKVARIYTYSFHEDMINLGVGWPDFEPQATQYVAEIIDFIQKLIKNGCAYEVDHDVYFSILSFKDYGKLKGQKLDELEKGHGRIEPNPKKKHPLDFALWKGVKEKDEYSFVSPWGKGRPGWHIECSTMNYSIFKNTLDIHAGGDDLIFPHHENEIAQSESMSGTIFAKYWLHNGMIMVDGKKMAKSEGNFITIKDALKSTTASAIRFFVLNSHYRMPLNYTKEAITGAQNGVNRLAEALESFESKELIAKKIDNDYTKEFIDAMSDDFNSPQALSVLFKLTDKINTEKERKVKQGFQETLVYLSNVLGFNLMKSNDDENLKDKTFSNLVSELVGWRIACRTSKDFKSSDKIREILNSCQIEVKDLPDNKYKWQIKI